MRQITILVTLMLFYCNAGAQTTLTAATSNPIIGDVFYNHLCSITGVSVGDTGSGVLWNFGTLVDSVQDTTNVVLCASTPYWDSLPVCSFAEVRMPDSQYNYYQASPGSLTLAGEHFPLTMAGVGYVYLIRPDEFLKYPATYKSSWDDTCLYWYYTSFASSHIRLDISNVIDGYGTLITPAGTYSNVLRVHTINFVTDSNYTHGLAVFHHRLDYYWWYTPDFHFPLLIVTTENDSATGAIIDFSMVEYSNNLPTTEVSAITNAKASVDVFPNPSNDIIFISGINENLENARISLFDMTGREMVTKTKSNENSGQVAMDLSTVPVGSYYLRIQNEGGAIVKMVQKM
jgi:type IX secretion system substrate protein